MTAMKHPTEHVRNVSVEGGHEYKSTDDGLFDVHPNHVQAMKSLGFVHASEVGRDRIEVQTPASVKTGDGAAKTEKTAEEAEAERKARAEALAAEKARKKAEKEGKGKPAGTEGAAGAEGDGKPKDEKTGEPDPLA